MNLTVNARDAMAAGGRLTIEITRVTLDEASGRLHPSAPPAPYALLTVSDTGVGMGAETRSHLFEPFFTTKPYGKGTGLGLATVYGVVKQSGGFIRVDSEPGEGSTFKIYLPSVTGEAAAPAARPDVSPRPGPRLPGGTETILLVEDEAVVRATVRRFLEAAGYTVLEASDGLEALAVAGDRPDTEIHILVTDVVMPRLKGHELAVRLRALRPRARVLFTSGHAGQAIADALPAGAAFLAKPFTPDALTRKVREVLDA
jgi:two-component system cell cycle sensor histidine kinase/response regulator CckA